MRTLLSAVIAIIDAELKHQQETSIQGEPILHSVLISQTGSFKLNEHTERNFPTIKKVMMI